MPTQYADDVSLGQAIFGEVPLGDSRRTGRLVTTFDRLCRHPGGTLPDKLSSPADLKALYRLCRCEVVTHTVLVAAMRAYTLEKIAAHQGPVLVIHDATELDFTTLKSLAEHLGQIGNGHYRGYVCQNVLAIDASTGDVLGLLDQPQTKRKARKDALFTLRGGPVLVLPPHAKCGHHGDDPLPLYVVYVREEEPPKGEKRLEWMLLTNEPVRNNSDARRVVEWYEKRWVIEEYHKALKTGCQIEDLQFSYVDRLQPAIALLSALALTLLNLRDLSRDKDLQTKPATDLFDREYVEVLSLRRYREKRDDLTVQEFFLALARLGGHQNRKSDHRPGWLIIWRGWTKLQLMLDGYELAKKKCG